MFFCMLTLLFLVRHGEIYAAEECTAPKHILFISSYSYSWGSVPWQIKGVARALQGTDYAVNYEFMDTKNTQYSDGYKEYYTLLKYKLASRCHYDGVIVADDAALNFAVLYRQELFAGAPIVFLAVDNIANAEKAAAAPDVTGIVEQADYARNIDAAGTLLPHADNVTFIFDNRENGIGIAAQLERQKAAFENYHVQYINTSSLTREAARTIRALPGRPDAESVPIIAMTANTFEEDVRRCMDAGMNRHLSKPIDPAELFQALAEAISTSQKIFAQS